MKFLALATVLLSFSAHSSLTEVARVSEGTIESKIKVAGKVVSEEGGSIIQTARIPGRVVTILKREGDVVRKGDPVLKVSGAECFALIEEKKRSVTSDLEDLKELVNQKVKQLEVIPGTIDCAIIATASGTITASELVVGSAFETGSKLLSIIDQSRLLIELDIPENELVNVKVGSPVSFNFTFDKKIYHSKIERIIPFLDPQTRSLKAKLKRAALPSNVAVDMLVYAEIDTANGSRSLKVPTTALVFYEGKRLVIKKEKEIFTPIYVDVVGEGEQFSIVKAIGQVLKPNDEIISRGGIFKLRELIMKGKF